MDLKLKIFFLKKLLNKDIINIIDKKVLNNINKENKEKHEKLFHNTLQHINVKKNQNLDKWDMLHYDNTHYYCAKCKVYINKLISFGDCYHNSFYCHNCSKKNNF